MNSNAPVLDQIRQRLVAGIPTYERHRRRRRLAGAVAAVLLVTLGGVTVLLATNEDDQRLATEGDHADPGDRAEPGVPLEELETAGIPAVLFATSGNRFGIAVLDLDTGTRAVYPVDEHTFGPGAISGAVLTDGGLIAWQDGSPTMHLRTAGPITELPTQDPVEIGTIVGQRQVALTDDDDRLWILGTGDTGDQERHLELVDLTTAEVILTTTAPAQAQLAGVRGDQAIVVDGRHQSDEHVILHAPSGATSTIAPSEPARFAAATEAATVWITSDQIYVLDDTGDAHQIPAPPGTQWAATGHATIPSNSPTSRTITADGTRLLVTLTDPTDPSRNPAGVGVVDLTERTVTPIEYAEPGIRPSTSFWARDDHTVIVITRQPDGEGQDVAAVDTHTFTATPIPRAVPDGFFVITGR